MKRESYCSLRCRGCMAVWYLITPGVILFSKGVVACCCPWREEGCASLGARNFFLEEHASQSGLVVCLIFG
jgi:hypothetical protein